MYLYKVNKALSHRPLNLTSAHLKATETHLNFSEVAKEGRKEKQKSVIKHLTLKAKPCQTCLNASKRVTVYIYARC